MASNTALLSFFTSDYQPLHDLNGPVKDAYCAKQGHKHIVKVAPYQPRDLYYAFDRLYFLRDLLFGGLPEGEGIDTVLVMNGHAQVMNHNVLVESFLDADHDFYITKDISGLNAGVFIVRKTEWLKTWLNHILSLEPIHKSKVQFEQTLFQENWERPEFKSRIKICPQNDFNSYRYDFYHIPTTHPGQFKPGDFCLHAPGKHVNAGNQSLLESRLAIFRSPEITSQIIW